MVSKLTTIVATVVLTGVGAAIGNLISQAFGVHGTGATGVGAVIGFAIAQAAWGINNTSNEEHASDNMPIPPDVNNDVLRKEEEGKKCLNGLGGWLILVGLGIVGDPLVSAFAVVSFFGIISELANPEFQEAFPLFSPFMYGATLLNALLVVAWVIVAYFFFRKKKEFPKLYIATSVLSLFLITSFFIVSNTVFYEILAGSSDGDYVNMIFRVVFIWYMIVSKRVKATFVN